ncbi:hypothetical protein MNBD_PLANCTO02-1247 [hydrothermal vent metagenome]|uniref:STAS domain-containing protein n=1 Tax=hydrothermal vent metagenome TaxID=652676 RepID=A0A3B1D6B5_9ZZZZ
MPTSRAPQISQHDHVTLVQLGDEYKNLDEHSLEDISTLLLDLAKSIDPPLMVLDLSHTKFFGSAFIELMFRTWNKIKVRDGGKFSISGLSKTCREVVDVTHIDRLWPVFETSEEAIESLRNET